MDADLTATALLSRAERHLHAAHAALDGTTSLPPSRRTRAAAVFARTALEHFVEAGLSARGHHLTRAGMRTRLICLRTLVDAPTGDVAAIAWAGLSQGCHHHAYELSPTWTAIHHLIGLVHDVADGVTGRTARRPAT